MKPEKVFLFPQPHFHCLDNSDLSSTRLPEALSFKRLFRRPMPYFPFWVFPQHTQPTAGYWPWWQTLGNWAPTDVPVLFGTSQTAALHDALYPKTPLFIGQHLYLLGLLSHLCLSPLSNLKYLTSSFRFQLTCHFLRKSFLPSPRKRWCLTCVHMCACVCGCVEPGQGWRECTAGRRNREYKRERD